MPDLHIAVVDDDPAVRDSLGVFLSRKNRTVICHPDGASFLVSVPEHPPDITFLDLKMPGLSGLDVLKRLDGPPFPIVMISAHGDIAAAVQAIKLGAVDFIEKPFAPEAVEEILADIPNLSRVKETASDEALSLLTEREREIALALNEGLTNKEVARRLDISPRTVEVHRAHIFQKIGIRNLAGLVRILARAN